MKKFITALSLLIAMISCGSSKPAGEIMAKLQNGMTVFDVEKNLGRPKIDKYLDNMKRVFVYKATDGYVVVFTENGFVTHFNPSTHIIFN